MKASQIGLPVRLRRWDGLRAVFHNVPFPKLGDPSRRNGRKAVKHHLLPCAIALLMDLGGSPVRFSWNTPRAHLLLVGHPKHEGVPNRSPSASQEVGRALRAVFHDVPFPKLGDPSRRNGLKAVKHHLLPCPIALTGFTPDFEVILNPSYQLRV